MGLPEWDVVRQMLEDKADFDGTSAGQEMLDADTAQLWWAGKEFFRDQVCVLAQRAFDHDGSPLHAVAVPPCSDGGRSRWPEREDTAHGSAAAQGGRSPCARARRL